MQAEKLYRKICPDEDFIPSPPDPEDIIIDDTAPRNSVNENEDNVGFSNYDDNVESQVEDKHDESIDTKPLPPADEVQR